MLTFMRRKVFLSIILSILFLQMPFAKPVSKQKAMQTAKAFLAEKCNMANVNLQLANKKTVPGTLEDKCFIFTNNDSKGFIIIAADDRSEPVLGYSNEGDLSLDDMPENLLFWLEGCIASAHDSSSGTHQAMPRIPAPPSSVPQQAIAPLLETSWNQISPYNLKCFMGNGKRSYAGCVATAMGQVMYYYKWPTTSIPAIPGYTAENGYKYSALPALPPFDWNIMKKTYMLLPENNVADQPTEAMANLMLYCGHAVKMIYREESAGAHTFYIIPAFKNYFGYTDKARLFKKKDFSNRAWSEMLEEELQNRRPVIYFGTTSAGSAHAFIIDGSDGQGMFHINWGAGGRSNGYFRLNGLRPSVLSDDHSAFDNAQSAIFGLSPHATHTPAPNHLATHFLAADSTATTLSNKLLTLTVNHTFSGLVNIANVDEALGLYHDGKQIALLPLDNQTYIIRDSLVSHTHQCQFHLPDVKGTYIIKPLNRESGDQEWDVNQDADQHYISLNFDHGKMTLKNVNTKEDTSQDISMAVVDVCQEFDYGLSPIRMQVKVRNTGTVDFNGTIYLGFNTTWEYHAQCAVDAGQEETVNFFVNKPIGSYNIFIYLKNDNYGNMFNMGKLTLTNKSPLPQLECVGTSFKNIEDNILYGRMFDGTVTLRNPSNRDYHGTIYYTVIHESSDYPCEMTETVDIKAGETVDLPIRFDNIEFGEQIHVENVQDGYHTYYTLSDTWTVTPGMVTWTSDGQRKATKPTLLMSPPEDAAAVSFEGLGVIRLKPNSNPNTIYYFDHDIYLPSSLIGKNVVIGDSAEQFRLVDDKGFYIPFTFHARNVSYVRTPTVGYDGQNGWSTIMLPFAVDEVADMTSTEKRLLTWGINHSPHIDGKDFWLKEITAISGDSIYLSPVRQWIPNKPYLIAFPDRNWGAQYQLTNHSLSFRSQDKQIMKTPECKVVVGSHEVVGTTGNQPLPQVYRLSPDGDSFVWTPSSVSKPYDAYLTCSDEQKPGQLHMVNEGVLKGDVNGDLEIDISDAMTVVNYLIEMVTNVFIKANADTDNNSTVNVVDLMNIVNQILMK